VTNCGGPRGGGFETLDDDAWRGALDLVLLSAVRLVRAALPHLRAAGGGRIVSVVSSSVRQPVEHLTLSNVLRPALAALVNDLAGAFAGEGILVNALAPGRIDTQRVRELDRSAAERQGISPEEAMRQSAARIPAGRYGEPDEFARAAAFLLSRENTYITGQVLLVDGGLVRAL
jgi:3-oxoacyl-[acyl-carrier protein] reductase